MADTIGKFIQPKLHSLTVDPNKVTPPPPLSKPAVIPFEPAPALTTPAVIATEPAPALSIPAVIPTEPAPPLSTPAVIPFEQAPPLTLPAVIATQPSPPLTLPAIIGTQQPPPLSIPAVIAQQPSPALSIPAVIPTQTAPNLTTPAVIPLEKAPPLSKPAVIPTQLPPALTTPAVIPTQPTEGTDFTNHSDDINKFLFDEDTGKAGIQNKILNPIQGITPALSTPAIIPPQPTEGIDFTFHSDDINKFTTDADPQKDGIQNKVLDPKQGSSPIINFPATVPGARDIGGVDPTNTKHPGAQPIQGHGEMHSDVVARAEAGNVNIENIDGIQGVFARIPYDVMKVLTSVNVHAPLGVEIPFLGTLPLDFSLNTHGGKINLGVSALGATIPRAVEKLAVDFGKKQINQLASNALSDATNALGSLFGKPQRGYSDLTRSIFGLPGPNNPRNNDFTKFVPSPAREPEEDPSKTILPKEFVQDMDPQFPYNSNSRNAAQKKQEIQAVITDRKLGVFNANNDNWSYVNEVENNNSFPRPSSDPFPDSLMSVFEPDARGLISGWEVQKYTTNVLTSVFKGPEGADGGGGQVSDETTGFFEHPNFPDDNSTYVPLVFTDMRPNDSKFKMVYFRPLIKSLTESIAPSWNLTNYFGRVDPVATYQNTARTIQLSFQLMAFSREDLDLNFKKLAWLSSMCYPQYKNDAYFAGPVTRMRVGDVISAYGNSGYGLPGVITHLELNYDETIWELDVDAKLPRHINVSVAFQVLHEKAIGTMDGKFGGIDGNYVDVTRFRAANGATDYINGGGRSTAKPFGSDPLASAILPEGFDAAAAANSLTPDQDVLDWQGLDSNVGDLTNPVNTPTPLVGLEGLGLA